MIIDLLPAVCVCVVIVAAAIVLGGWLSVILPETDSRLDIKPFNCRPCLTFHLCWMMMAAVAYIVETCYWFVAGVMIALVVFFVVRHIDNQKIEK